MSEDARTDRELVEAANDGDLGAFDALYLRYRDWVVRLAWRFTRSDSDALDVLQETFHYLLRKLPRLRLTARMTTFLYPVVRNLSIRAQRRKRRAAPGDDILPDLPAPPSPKRASRKELAAVLRTLPEEQLEVVLMRFVDDMALAEIAEALSIPLGTVKSRLHNALNALREDPRTRSYFLE